MIDIKSLYSKLNALRVNETWEKIFWISLSVLVTSPIIILIWIVISADLDINITSIIFLVLVFIWFISFISTPISFINKITHSVFDDTILNNVINNVKACNEKPLFCIKINTLDKFNKIDNSDMPKLCVDNISYFKEQCELYTALNTMLAQQYVIIHDILDNLISTNILITTKDRKNLLNAINLFKTKYDDISFFVIKITYDSPAGRNHYEKAWSLKRDDMQNLLHQTQEYINNASKKDSESSKYNTIELEMEKALALFMLDIPFSKSELKSQRNKLLKSFHPDANNNSSSIYAVKIKNAYDLLLEYATD